LLANSRVALGARVVAIVLNWNGWQDTIECLESLLACETAPEHVVVCDNGSTDGSLSHLREWAAARSLPFALHTSPNAAMHAQGRDVPWLIFIENGSNGGYAAGNNVGIRFALERMGADFVWVLNNDVVVDPQALERMLATARDNDDAAMIGSALLRYDAPDTIQALGGGYIRPVFCHDTQLGRGKPIGEAGTTAVQLDHLIGASLLVRAGAIANTGLIDESYFLYREETDWCIRMRRRGWKLLCCPDALVWHKQARSIGFKSSLHDYYAVRNVLRLVAKFYPLSLPTAFGYFACRSLAPKIMRGQFARAGAVCRALIDFSLGVRGRRTDHTDAVLTRQYADGIAPGRRRQLRIQWLALRARLLVRARLLLLPLVALLMLSSAGMATQFPAPTSSVPTERLVQALPTTGSKARRFWFWSSDHIIAPNLSRAIH
jgi:GT2 family glycosyltransferase